MMSENKTFTEEFSVTGEEILAKIKELIKEGRTLIEVPLTLGVVGVILVPVWAAIGAVAALVSEATIVVEKNEK
jgi:hypothetical protein